MGVDGFSQYQIKIRLTQILGDPKTPLEVLVFSAITLGLVYVASCNEEIAQTIILAIMDRSETELGEPLTRLLPVALGLLYLGKQVKILFICQCYLFNISHISASRDGGDLF